MTVTSEVVFAIDVITRRFQQISQGCSVGRVTPVPDVQRTGRICRNELEEDPGLRPGFLAAVTYPLL